MRSGIEVTCTTCGRTKKPIGRDSMSNDGCTREECDGYSAEPYPGCLWPGETEWDFGYRCGDSATEEIAQFTLADVKAAIRSGVLRGYESGDMNGGEDPNLSMGVVSVEDFLVETAVDDFKHWWEAKQTEAEGVEYGD